LNAETVKNYARGVGAIEGVKVNAGHVVIQKIVTLFQGEVNSDAPDSFRIVFASLKSAQKPGRKACATGQSAMRLNPLIDVTGMIPAIIGM
jgi:hypothetical protein